MKRVHIKQIPECTNQTIKLIEKNFRMGWKENTEEFRRVYMFVHKFHQRFQLEIKQNQMKIMTKEPTCPQYDDGKEFSCLIKTINSFIGTPIFVSNQALAN